MRFLPSRLLSYLFLVISSLLLFVQPAFAQSKEIVPNTLHNYTQQVLLDLSSALTCQLVGIDPSGPDPQTGEPRKCLGYDLTTGALSFVGANPSTSSGQVGGAVGAMTNFIAVLYTKPVSTGQYFEYLAQNFGIVKPAYAQGVGFEGLKPLLALWAAFRNIVYLLFVVVFVVIGLAIMLRLKIDPRTVMTIENQIPKLIIGLLLVTFSFAIAGFLIDLMYIAIYLASNIISSADPNLSADIALRLIQSPHPLDAANVVGMAGKDGGILAGLRDIAGKPAEAIGGYIAPVFDNPTGRFITGLVMAFIGKFLAEPTTDLIGAILTLGGGAIGTILGPGVGTAAGISIGITLGKVIKVLFPVAGAVGGTIFAKDILGAVASLIAFLIISIAILWALLRLWFQLLKAYIFILFDVVFAPFFIVFGTLPGRSVGPWFRDIIANLSVFPTTITLFLLAKVFIDVFAEKGMSGQFVPPLIGYTGDPSGLGALIGLGVILLTPQVVNMMRETLKAPEFKYLAAIGQAVGVGTGGLAGTAGRFGTIATGYELAPAGGVRRVGVVRGLLRTFFGG